MARCFHGNHSNSRVDAEVVTNTIHPKGRIPSRRHGNRRDRIPIRPAISNTTRSHKVNRFTQFNSFTRRRNHNMRRQGVGGDSNSSSLYTTRRLVCDSNGIGSRNKCSIILVRCTIRPSKYWSGHSALCHHNGISSIEEAVEVL